MTEDLEPRDSGPALPSHAQVVVIGGGIIGCSVAYHLTKLGWRDGNPRQGSRPLHPFYAVVTKVYAERTHPGHSYPAYRIIAGGCNAASLALLPPLITFCHRASSNGCIWPCLTLVSPAQRW